jgi:hypothetical protein
MPIVQLFQHKETWPSSYNIQICVWYSNNMLFSELLDFFPNTCKRKVALLGILQESFNKATIFNLNLVFILVSIFSHSAWSPKVIVVFC